ncbi:MAG: hypothetical protein KID00_15335 [Clostridium argentinense]|uniref:Uncharacterized protein n=1 Tax=Clostridium faecium TaxID=2762223 RepID=A0ABR8YQ69_9CLOT|nr:hypothetical protein [Clostridium faecium]MBD8046385.1 hypothetical protein [Clostridium faecium]MBS5825195.1 hypothetical protein [Clostridium argentinense]MDU1350408.1 hypothetical protein [Clostridium argentinense]
MKVILINIILLIILFLIYKYLYKSCSKKLLLDIFILTLYTNLAAPLIIFTINLILRKYYNLNELHLIFTFFPLAIPTINIYKEKNKESSNRKILDKYEEKIICTILKELEKQHMYVNRNSINIAFNNLRGDFYADVIITLSIPNEEYDYFKDYLEKSLSKKFKDGHFNVTFKIYK